MVEENMPPVLGFTMSCGLAVPSNEWRADGGRQVAGHETGRKVNIDADDRVVRDKCFPAS